MNYIFVDDERNYEINPIIFLKRYLKEPAVVYIFRNADDAINCIKNLDNFYIDLDHDLGLGKSGYDIAKYIVEHNLPCKGYRVHSMNPVGRANIDQLLSHYNYWRFM